MYRRIFFAENEAEVYDVDVFSDVDDFPYEETGISPDYNWRVGKNILPVYKYENRVIWGVTARIVRSFSREFFKGFLRGEANRP